MIYLRSNLTLFVTLLLLLMAVVSCSYFPRGGALRWSDRQLASTTPELDPRKSIEQGLMAQQQRYLESERENEDSLFVRARSANRSIFDGNKIFKSGRAALAKVNQHRHRSKKNGGGHSIIKPEYVILEREGERQVKEGKELIAQGQKILEALAWFPVYAFEHELEEYQVNFDQLPLLFQYDIELNRRWREGLIKLYNSIDWEIPLSGQDLTSLFKYIKHYEMFARYTLIYAKSFRSLVDGRYQLILTDKKPTSVEIDGSPANSIITKLGLSSKWKLNINPNDRRGVLIIAHMKLGLAAALLLYDNFSLATNSFQTNTKLRIMANYDYERIQMGLKRVARDYFNLRHFRELARASNFLKEDYRWEDEQKQSHPSSHYALLDQVIENSETYNYLEEKGRGKLKFTKYQEQIQFRVHNLIDYFRRKVSDFTYSVSQLFGNVVGMVTFRKGKLLKNIDKQYRQRLAQQLRPLDILLEKTPFRLTDYFIPGHFGHLAIWTGSKDDLIRLNLWNHPIIQPHQHAIEFEGKRLIEALRSGVQLSSLDHFLDIDDLAVLRPKPLAKDRRQNYLLNTFRQLGKEYDFNFDVETNNRLVCSELAYVTFDDLRWPYERHVGRFSISPDNVLEITFRSDGPFIPILLYHDGKRIEKNLEQNLHYLQQQQYHLVK